MGFIFIKKMKSLLTLFLSSVLITVSAQDPGKIMRDVAEAQKKIKTISYTTHRLDTFTSGDIWNHTGKVKSIRQETDQKFGFLFWGKRDDVPNEVIYDGHMTYDLNTEKKTYEAKVNREHFIHVLGSPGGQMIFKDLIRLDTSYARSFEVRETRDHFFLRMKYADNPQYSIVNRYKELAIDRKTMLPVKMVDHLEALGKPQTITVTLSDIKINEPGFDFDPVDKHFLQDYQQEIPQPNRQLQSLVGKPFPTFALTSFTGANVSSDIFKNKVVLLDFWEVWCGPCIASMPKVQKLHEQYKDKGLLVYGITNEVSQLASARKLIEKIGTTFPMLAGNEKLKQDYHVNAVPLYILIDKQGKVSFVHEGFSEELEQALKNLINQ